MPKVRGGRATICDNSLVRGPPEVLDQCDRFPLAPRAGPGESPVAALSSRRCPDAHADHDQSRPQTPPETINQGKASPRGARCSLVVPAHATWLSLHG